MGLFGAISSGLSSFCSVVSSSIGVIGSVATRFCTSVLPRIAPVLTKTMGVVSIALQVIDAVLKIYSVFKPDEKIDEVGDKAIQAAEEGITPDRFDDFDDYMASLRDFQPNPMKSESIPMEAKLAAGLTIGAKGLDSKMDVPDGTMEKMWVLVANNPEYFNTDRITAILSSTKDVSALLDYFDGKLSITKSEIVEQKLVSAEKALNPDKDDNAIFNELDSVCKSIQQ